MLKQIEFEDTMLTSYLDQLNFDCNPGVFSEESKYKSKVEIAHLVKNNLSMLNLDPRTCGIALAEARLGLTYFTEVLNIKDDILHKATEELGNVRVFLDSKSKLLEIDNS